MRIRGRFEKLWISAVPIVYVAAIQLFTGLAGIEFSGGADQQSPGFSERLGLALVAVVAGATSVATVVYLTRNRGLNEVYGTTAVEAATSHAELDRRQRPPTRMVSDRELAAMASTAFSPPEGIEPWQGQVLLQERIDHRTADAFLAELVLSRALDIDEDPPRRRVLVPGPRFDDADDEVRRWMNQLLGQERSVDLGRFDDELTAAMTKLGDGLERQIKARHWWRPNSGPIRRSTNRIGHKVGAVANAAFWTYVGVFAMFGWLFFLTFVLVFLRGPLALAVGTFALSSVAAIPSRFLDQTSRTAEGSAFTLQVESFRRFLERSETKFVEHGWSHRIIRDYAAWAIAIADAEAVVPELARAGIIKATDVASLFRALEITITDADKRSSRD